MKTIIELESMEFYAYHGCYETERVVGGRFMVDVTIETSVDEAARADRLDGSINYLNVFRIVKEQMERPSNIIENVAMRIIDGIYEKFPECIKVTTKVSKLTPPVGGKVEKVSVTLSM